MDNPYASPQTPYHGEASEREPAAAVNHATWTLILWLTPAAIVHAFWFAGWVLRGFYSGLSAATLQAVSGEVLVLVAPGVLLAWFATPPLLMGASEILRRILSPQSPQSDWQRILADSMPSLARKAPWFMVGWLIGTTEMWTNGFAVVGPLMCHLLAACWYLPLLARWWRLRNTPSREAV